jgi:NCS2 family nucleobase:cation symporter-2
MTMPAVHPVDETRPLPRLAALGLRHVLVMHAGAMALNLNFKGGKAHESAAMAAAKAADSH